MDSVSGLRARQAGKMLVPLLGILVVLAMGVAAFAIVLQMQEREKRLATEQELHLARGENESLKSKLEELDVAKTRVEEDLTRVKQELAKSQDELIKVVEAKETLARSVEDREKEIGRITKDLEQTRSEAKQVNAQLAEIQSERDTMKRQLADLERAKMDLETKVMELSEKPTVELEKVLVTGDDTASGSPSAAGAAVLPVSTTARVPSEGQVVVVNREYDFVVMNLGKNQGLSIGQEFQIVRGNEVLGKVKIEKIYDELSAAAILPESKKSSIREGDVVRPL
jgi:archaellum component FlaC